MRARSMRSTDSATSAKVGREVPSTTASRSGYRSAAARRTEGMVSAVIRGSTFEVIAVGTIPGVVERAAATYVGRPALVSEAGTVTFDELLELVRAAAGALIEAGV